MSRRETSAVNPTRVGGEKAARKRPPTSADVARLARVSQATVSLVLNDVGNSRFSDETRDRVLNAAEVLGYVPHAMASSLRSGQSNLVLITFLTMPTGPALSQYYEQVATELNRLGYTVLFHVDRSMRGVKAARSWASLRPAGVIVDAGRLTDEAVEVMHKAGVKAIVAIGGIHIESVPTFGLNDELIGECAAEYLVSTGRSRLAVVVPRDPQLLEIGVERLCSAERVTRPLGIPLERLDLGLDEVEAALIVAEWKRGARPDGIFTYNDVYGSLLLSALQDAGLRVPEDVALVGCDDLPFGEFLRPRLTTIRWPTASMARRLAGFIDALAHERSPEFDEPRQQEPYIVVRDTA